MKVLIIYAHPNPVSFTRSILDNFVRGLNEAGHQYEIVDLYKIKFNPVLQDSFIENKEGNNNATCFFQRKSVQGKRIQRVDGKDY